MNRLTIDINPYQTIIEEHRQAFRLFEELLVEENEKFNLTRITSPEQVRTRHFLDSLAGLGILDSLSTQLQKNLRIVDVGSGAGFPGLALAVVRPNWSVVSLEATGKKTLFQKKVCKALNLNNVQVIHGRAEDIAHQKPFREMFDAVTARALAQMPVLSELVLGLLREKGLALFWKGSAATEEMAQAESAIKQMGGSIEQLASYALSAENEEAMNFSLVICRKIHSTPKQYPRAFGTIKKQPLGGCT